MEVIIDNNHLKVESNWQRLWKLQVPNKIKNIFVASAQRMPTSMWKVGSKESAM
jgi:hypothetical protein